jgi:DNA-binding transcriptional LysR family regulator
MIDSLTLFNRLTSRTKLRHMLALVRLVELRNMGRAAKDIGITQPAMSQLVADLEDLLEAQLFLRHARGVEPTPLAYDLAEVAQRIISAVEDGTEVVASRMNAEQGFIRIAYTLAAYQAVLDWALPEYVEQNQSCRVQLDEVIGHSLNTTFASGDYDLVFCRQTDMVGSGWSFVPCAQDRLVVVCGPHHPLAQKTTLTDEDLSNATWVAGHVATQVRRGYDKIFSDNGWTAAKETQVVSRSARVLLTVIRKTQSIGLMPESIARVWCRDGLAVQLPTDPRIELGTLGFYWRPSKASLPVRRFAKMISTDL